jgi:mono/diheme cytochrome c family protein
MRLKSLAVILMTLLAAVTMLLWFTDLSRRESLGTEHEEELLHFGEVIYSESETEPAAAGCARCHGEDGTGGPIPNDPDGRSAPSLRTASLAEKLRVNPEYVRLVVSYGGVVVSGNVNSPMPAWSTEVGGPLNEQQIEAVVTLVEGWAEEAASEAPEEVEDTVEAGRQVYATAGCASCHGQELEGSTAGPNITSIGENVITDFGGEFAQPSDTEAMTADYEEDPRLFLERWIRDSAGNYNGGDATGMPPHPENVLGESQLQALITFLLDQDGSEE